ASNDGQLNIRTARTNTVSLRRESRKYLLIHHLDINSIMRPHVSTPIHPATHSQRAPESRENGACIHSAPGPISESYRTHPITTIVAAPPNRTVTLRHPLEYSRSVNVPCAPIQRDSLNQAFGDTSMNNALRKTTAPSTTMILIPRTVLILHTH